MFDYITADPALHPDIVEGDLYQTKDLGCELGYYHLSESGIKRTKAVSQWDDGITFDVPENLTGCIHFYELDIEFVALLKHGKVIHVERIE